jgi:hypothetical protein
METPYLDGFVNITELEDRWTGLDFEQGDRQLRASDKSRQL